MTNPTPANPITLDLRGTIPTPLHRPRLAALACWLFATAIALELAFAMWDHFARIAWPETFNRIWWGNTSILFCLLWQFPKILATLATFLLAQADLAKAQSIPGPAASCPSRRQVGPP